MRWNNLLNKKLLVFYSLAGIGMLGHGLFRPIIPLFARSFGATGFEVGLLTSGFMVARGLTAFIIGRNIDRSGRKKVFVLIGFFTVFLIALGYIFATNYYHILFLRFLQGICSGLMWPTTQIMVVEIAKKCVRTRALSLYQITGKIGALLSRVLLSLILLITAYYGLAELRSFKVVFLCASIILFFGFIDVILMPEHKHDTVRKKGGRPPYSIFLLAFVVGALLAIGPLSIVFFHEYYGISLVSIAVLLLILDLATMLAMYFSSHFTDNIGVRKSLWIIIIPCFITALCLPFARYFIIFVVLYFIMRMAISSFIPISRSYATSLDTEVGANIGVLNMMTNLGSVFGPIIGGIAYDKLSGSFKMTGYAVVALLLVPGILIQLYPYIVRIAKNKKK